MQTSCMFYWGILAMGSSRQAGDDNGIVLPTHQMLGITGFSNITMIVLCSLCCYFAQDYIILSFEGLLTIPQSTS